MVLNELKTPGATPFEKRSAHPQQPMAFGKIGLRAEHERRVLSNYHNSNLLILREFFLTLSACRHFSALGLGRATAIIWCHRQFAGIAHGHDLFDTADE
jgi:hypothetical protein